MGITISILGGMTKDSSSAIGSGNDERVISNKELTLFGLSVDSLSNAIEKYFGKKPNDTFLSSPTPWGDLYIKYGWSQVQAVLVVDSATVTDITDQLEVVNAVSFKNGSSISGTFNCGISQSVFNTVTHETSYNNQLKFGLKVNYAVKPLGVGVEGEISFDYSHDFGSKDTKSEMITIGQSAGLIVTLAAGQEVKSVLTASRGKMKVRVVYRIHLTGDIAVNYDPTFKDHHFHALPIESVMQAAGIENNHTVTEDIEIGFYSNARVELQDPSTGAALSMYEFSGEMHLRP
jgi:hypothetical protein